MGSLFGPGIMIMLAVFAGIILFLYIASIIWAVRDSAARGGNWKVALLVSLIPFAGVLVYLLMRPPLFLIDKEEQELDIALKRRQLSKYGNCANCGQPVKDDFIMCPSCQKRIRNVCANCGRAIEFSWKACPYCGRKVNQAPSYAQNNNYSSDNSGQTQKQSKPQNVSQKSQSAATATKSHVVSKQGSTRVKTQANNTKSSQRKTSAHHK